jgi:hypothetical protein
LADAATDVNKLLGLLLAQKRSMESETKHEELELLLDFLYRTKQQHKSVRGLCARLIRQPWFA